LTFDADLEKTLGVVSGEEKGAASAMSTEGAVLLALRASA
jgi:hypothetical protein